MRMIPLTYKENKSCKKQKVCYICKKEFTADDDNKKYYKVRDHGDYSRKYKGVAHSICNLMFHNGSTYRSSHPKVFCS